MIRMENEITPGAWILRICGTVGIVTATVLGSLAAGAGIARATQSICDNTAGNLVQNCGFELNTNGDAFPIDWTTDAGYALHAGTFNRVVADPGIGTGAGPAHSGNNQLYFGNFDSEPLAGISQVLTTTPGASYAVSFFINYSAGIGADSNALFEARLDGSNEVSVTGGLDAPSGWTLKSFTFIGSGSDTLFFGAKTNPNEWGLDDVVVQTTAVPEPPSLALMGAALAGLFLGRPPRRRGAGGLQRVNRA
jgi:hypothetical protein